MGLDDLVFEDHVDCTALGFFYVSAVFLFFSPHWLYLLLTSDRKSMYQLNPRLVIYPKYQCFFEVL